MDAEEVVLEHMPLQELRSQLVVRLNFNRETILWLSSLPAPALGNYREYKQRISDGLCLQEGII